MSVSYGGDSVTFADGSVTSSGWTGFKNRIINGAMTINQRTGTANTTMAAATDVYTLDRWLVGNGAGISANVAISTDAPAGFNNSLKISIVTTSTSSNTMYLMQKIEGYNSADLNWGTASAATCTLSFWVKSSVAGTYNAYLFPAGADRSYIAPFTISQANTWEKETITITGDTAGTWNVTNGHGIQISIALNGTGNAYATSTINQWFAGTKFIYSSGTNLATNAGATFQITGVQFERGSTASSFEYRPYGTELALCQRYLPAYLYSSASGMETVAWVRGGSSASIATAQIPFQVTPRVPPTGLTVVGTFAVSGLSFSGVAFAAASIVAGGISLSGGSSMTVYYMYELQCSTAGSKLLWTGCEL